MDYREYTIMLSEYRLKEELHERLRQLVEGNSQVVKYLFKKSNNKDANFQVGISADAWQELDTNWQKVAAQVLAFCSLACHEMIKFVRSATGNGCLTLACPATLVRSGSG